MNWVFLLLALWKREPAVREEIHARVVRLKLSPEPGPVPCPLPRCPRGSPEPGMYLISIPDVLEEASVLGLKVLRPPSCQLGKMKSRPMTSPRRRKARGSLCHSAHGSHRGSSQLSEEGLLLTVHGDSK